MAIDSFKLSEKEKDQLIKLKRLTGLKNWNVLCRWALCVSLAESSQPAEVKILSDSSVEMTWKTFGNPYQDIYLALIKHRLQVDGIDLSEENIERYFRLHLMRGLNYLTADASLHGIATLLLRGVRSSPRCPEALCA